LLAKPLILFTSLSLTVQQMRFYCTVARTPQHDGGGCRAACGGGASLEVRMRSAPGVGGTFQFQIFIQTPSPEIRSETISGSEEGPGGEVG